MKTYSKMPHFHFHIEGDDKGLLEMTFETDDGESVEVRLAPELGQSLFHQCNAWATHPTGELLTNVVDITAAQAEPGERAGDGWVLYQFHDHNQGLQWQRIHIDALLHLVDMAPGAVEKLRGKTNQKPN